MLGPVWHKTIPKLPACMMLRLFAKNRRNRLKKAKVLDIVWTRKEVYDEREARDRCYVLRTDRTDFSDREIWETYVTLTRVEKII